MPAREGATLLAGGAKERKAMAKTIGWMLFTTGLLVIIIPIAIAVYFEGDVPYSLYAIPWTSIGFLIVGWKMAHKKKDY